MIYLLYGTDDFSIRETVAKLLRAALPEETADLNTTRLTATDISPHTLQFACEASPFLADRRVVIVERFFSRAASRRGRAAKAKDGDSAGEPKHLSEVAAYLPNVPPNTLLVFVETDAPPKSGPVARALEASQVKQQFFPTLAGAPLTRWVKERAKVNGGQIGDRAASMLATFVGGDLHSLSNEIQKLVAYAGPGRAIEPEDIQLLVNQVGEVNVFALVDAVGQGQRKNALVALHKLLDNGERPERIMVMIARQIRLLLQAREGLDRREPPDSLARSLGLTGFPLRKVLEQARLFASVRLLEMHRSTLETDLNAKTGQQDPSLALELLVTELTARERTRRPKY
jgi:DNA polymerase III subunit delta